MTYPPPKSFHERLQVVLCGRPPTTWALRVGWNKAAIHAVTRGHVPGPDLLLRAARAENLSMDWWLEGVGMPFRVTRCFSVAEALQAVERTKDDGGPWDVHVVRADTRAALVMTRDDLVLHETGTPPRQIHYTRVEVIAGGVSADAIYTALPVEPYQPMGPRKARGYEVVVRSPQLDELEAGQLGTYRICGAGWGEDEIEIEPLCEGRVRIEDRDRFVGANTWATHVAEPAPQFITPDEATLLERYRRLPPAQRQSVASITEALATPKP